MASNLGQWSMGYPFSSSIREAPGFPRQGVQVPQRGRGQRAPMHLARILPWGGSWVNLGAGPFSWKEGGDGKVNMIGQKVKCLHTLVIYPHIVCNWLSSTSMFITQMRQGITTQSCVLVSYFIRINTHTNVS